MPLRTIPIFGDKNRQNNPVHGVSEIQTGGSPPVGGKRYAIFIEICSFCLSDFYDKPFSGLQTRIPYGFEP
jgi:hypothetical protein